MYENIVVTPKENSQIEITGDISVAALSPFRKKALERFGQTAKIPGFRPGHIPEKVLIEKFGETTILESAAEMVFQEIVPELIEKHAARYMARPNITITKLAPGNALSFSILVAVRPIITLPDYKKIATEEIASSSNEKERQKLDVSDKEIDAVIEQVKNDYAHREFHKHNPNTNHDHVDADIEKYKPEITDDFVKTLGEFKDIADFKQKIKENLIKEKEYRLLEKRRAKMLERLAAETKFSIPQPLVDYEINRMMGQFEDDTRRLGLSVENYLNHIKKTREELRKEWLPEAEKRARINFVLEEIALVENLRATPDEIEQEVRRLKTRYADIDTTHAENYVSHILTLEKTITFLEAPARKE